MSSVISQETRTRVSSVLNRDVKQFGKKYLFDGDEETCWNSDQGSPQWIQVTFSNPTHISELHIKFQGGFVGRECFIEGCCEEGGKDMDKITDFYPQDINSSQIFPINCEKELHSVRIVFTNSTDFFGRITIYKLDLL